MVVFQLFDEVKLTEDIDLIDGGISPKGTVGAIVEVFKNGEAYMVELFDNWVKYDDRGNPVSATQDETGAFMETLGVETVYPHQLESIASARETQEITNVTSSG
ncbi:MAG: DUF4926 domain-containing protein [Spirulina sp.]